MMEKPVIPETSENKAGDLKVQGQPELQSNTRSTWEFSESLKIKFKKYKKKTGM